MMYRIFLGKCVNKAQLLKECIKEIDWNLLMTRKLGSGLEMKSLRSLLIK